LYTLSKAGCVVGYSITGDGMHMFAKIDRMSAALKTFVENERSRSAAVGVQKHDLQDVEVVALDVSVASYIHLIITTSRGIRIFLTSSDGPAAATSRSWGKSLKVVCVRGPPQKDRLNEVRSNVALYPGRNDAAVSLIPAGPSTSAPVTRASKSMGGVAILTFAPLPSEGLVFFPKRLIS